MIDFNPYGQNYSGTNSRVKPIAYQAVLSYKFSNEFPGDETEPVTLQEAKDWCMVDGPDYDAKLTMLITAARKKVERVRQMSLINRTVTANIKPGTNLPFGPVKAITSITDDDDNTYEALTDVTCTDVTVVYTAGPGEAGLAEDLKIEILQQIAFMLDNRGDATTGSGGISPMIKGNNRVSNRTK